jgi:hypothetical protein
MHRLSSTVTLLLVICMSILAACEGSQGPQGPAGPAGPTGDEGPQGPQGEDGNANVTRHMFPGHDFSTTPDTLLTISGVDSTEMRASEWNVYLVDELSNAVAYDHIPGVTALGDTYSVAHGWVSSESEMRIGISLEDGTGTDYEQIEVVQTVASNSNDQTAKATSSGSIIPDHVDVTNYKELAEYYNFDNTDKVEVR